MSLMYHVLTNFLICVFCVHLWFFFFKLCSFDPSVDDFQTRPRPITIYDYFSV